MSLLPRYSPQRLTALAVLSGYEPPSTSSAKILELDPRDAPTSVRIASSINSSHLDLVAFDQELKNDPEVSNVEVIHRLNGANQTLEEKQLLQLESRAPYSFIVAHFPHDCLALFAQLKRLSNEQTMLTFVNRVLPGASLNSWIGDYLKTVPTLLKQNSLQDSLKLLGQLVANDERPFPILIKREVERVVNFSQERLKELYHPDQKFVTFAQILKAASENGFTYLGDAEMDSSVLREELLSNELFQRLSAQIGHEFEQEQFLDTLLFRSVRQPVFARSGIQPDTRPLHERLAFARLVLTVELEEEASGNLFASAVGLNRFEISDKIAVQSLKLIKKEGAIECYRLVSQVLDSFRIPYGEQLTVREYLVGVIDMYLRLGFLEIHLDQ